MSRFDQDSGWTPWRLGPLWALLLLWLVALPVSAQERLALVIGNTAYDGTTFSHLQRGPVLDAEGVGAKLKALGFTLVHPDGDGKPVINAGMQQMRGALSLFTRRLHQSPGAMAFVFYAGHGIAAKDSADADEKTYLIPVNAPIVFENDAQEYALSLDKVVRDIEGARASVGVVVLDACRNNGLQSPWRNSLTRGVVLPKYASNGVMVAFSTKAGSVAENSPQSMSVFSRALVNRLGTPGQTLFDTFLSVRADVTQQSQQVPQVSLVDLAINPVLVPGQAVPVPIPGPTPPVVITGSLNVTTTPAGASVHIDGAYAGTGPAVISDLAGGSTVTVRVEKSGFESQERKVRVPAGQMLAVAFSLTKQPVPRPVPTPGPNGHAPAVAAKLGRSVQNTIGLNVESLDAERLEQLGLDHGVRVVQANGASEYAGIRAGDILLRLNATVIASVADFDRAVAALPAGKSVPVLVQRDGGTAFLALRVPG